MDNMPAPSYMPDYSGDNIVNLMVSIAAALGADAPEDYPSLAELSPSRLAAKRHIVLWVIDGLGYSYLTQRHPRSTLHDHLHGRLISVFPSTTATAITTFFTGAAPQQHAVTGWFTYLREIGSIATFLPFTPRHGGPPYSTLGYSPAQFIGRPTLFDRGERRRLHVVTADWIADSDYSRAMGGGAGRDAYHDLPGLVDHLRRLLRAEQDSYIFAYWPNLDSTAHRSGIGSPEADAHFQEIDAAYTRLLDALRGTDSILIVTADHGLIDTRPEQIIHIEDHPTLVEALTLPLCGEPRAAFCYLRPGYEQQFAAYVEEQLGHACRALPSTVLIEAGYFGRGRADPRLHTRVGDYTLLMKGDYVVKDRIAGERPFHQIGVHGGVSADELFVPLIVAED